MEDNTENTENNDKVIEYSKKIIQALEELFKEESDCFISQEELLDGDNLTHFFHALGNVVPANLYSQTTGEDINILDFNHIANKLCFQNAKK
jgi:hypothetical protein